MSIPKVYFHRGSMISGKRGEWWVHNDPNPEATYRTIEDAKNAVDKFVGGHATKRIPSRIMKKDK